jgi:agmatinase
MDEPRRPNLGPLPTYLDAPIGDFDGIRSGMVVVSGAPYVARDRGIQPFGPRAIRAASAVFVEHTRIDSPAGALDFLSGRTWRNAGADRMIDIGDFNVHLPDVMRSTEGIAGGVAEVVRRGGFSVCLGGDHYVGYPSCLGFSRAIAEKEPNARIGYIHIDGHLDFTDEYATTGRYNNGTNARRISELPNVNPRNMSWIGIQGPCGHEPMAVIRRHGAKVFTSEDIHGLGPEAVARQAAEHAMDGTDYIYMSFDIDVVDAGFSNGTGSVTMGAVTPIQLLRMLDVLAGYPIAAMDLVETSPDLDPSNRTTILAAESLLRLIAPKILLID